MKLHTKAKICLKQALGLEIKENIDITLPLLKVGNNGCDWIICPKMVKSGDIVYSFGIGTDISFDEEVISRFGVNVFAFDPTPRSMQWLENQKLPQNFKAFEIALSNADGEISLSMPSNSQHVSYQFRTHQEATEVFAAKKLSTIMSENQHKILSICKIDIEGAEIQVIQDIVSEQVQIQQLLVEFHHRFEPNGLEMVKSSISLLRKNGYKLFAIAESCEEFSFVNEMFLPNR